jgi:hypothetical protein
VNGPVCTEASTGMCFREKSRGQEIKTQGKKIISSPHFTYPLQSFPIKFVFPVSFLTKKNISIQYLLTTYDMPRATAVPEN